MPDLTELQFPRWLHKPSIPPAWISRKVETLEECQQAIEDGWSVTAIILNGEQVTEEPATESEPDGDAASPTDTPKRKGWPKGKPRKPKEGAE